jgi:hypothetical protein
MDGIPVTNPGAMSPLLGMTAARDSNPAAGFQPTRSRKLVGACPPSGPAPAVQDGTGRAGREARRLPGTPAIPPSARSVSLDVDETREPDPPVPCGDAR